MPTSGPHAQRHWLIFSDLHLLPWLSFLYLLSFLDRTNIGNANLFGLSADLGLNPTQYSACLAVFFAMYVTFEVPSNMVMKVSLVGCSAVAWLTSRLGGQ